MATPQQPELARSRKTPAQDPDAAASVLEAHGQPGDSGGPGGPVPPDNQPGHHPPTEQDKPDLDAFAAKMGIGESEPQPEPEPAPGAAATSAPGSSNSPIAPRVPYWKAAGIAGIAVVAGAGVGIRRRRHRTHRGRSGRFRGRLTRR